METPCRRTIPLRRVVVTGIGLLSPTGKTTAENWSNVRNGKGGIGPITRFDTTNLPCRIAGEIKDYDPLTYFDRKDLKKYDPYIQYALIAAEEAIRNSALDLEKEDRDRIGVFIGSGIGGIQSIENNKVLLLEKGPERVSPFFLPSSIANLGAGQVSIRFGLKGPNYANCTACATSTHSIGDSFRTISYGDADIMIAGGAEAPITQLSIAGFSVIKAMSTRNDQPEKASRPFDRERDGFIIAEGAGLLVLEELGHALRRGAPILAEIIGYGATGDAFHMTAPDPEADGAYRSMKRAVADAGLKPEEVDYINAHGTSTPLNDKLETKAIKRLFGDHASRVSISSTKSMTGHMLGATGGVEAAFCVLALKEGFIPPTINYEFPDPECDLFYVPNVGVEKPIQVAMSNSFGFGGTNGTVVFRKYQGQ